MNDTVWVKMGNHITLDIHDIENPDQVLNDRDFLEDIMRHAIRLSGATIIDTIHHVFDPQGLTLLFLLAESHASIHTYPEKAYAAFDFFTCGDICQPRLAANYILKTFHKYSCDETNWQNIKRGFNGQNDV